ncbi:MFS transporter [Mycolicibacterium komossense]|uniref:MFS transporter n=1 Tax=Mycolicibacterium komossense TaxID=1779 RepID=A0ABT3C7C0_9MYCO|nr:MFS transporter [Mycolicibacterium komossense]MCV7225348.1 MFS transporter [Mycolicibacterium komossense]
MSNPAAGSRISDRSRVIAWALWDCGSTGMSAIVVTFVFSVYLTGSVGEGMPGGASPASWLGRALTIAGLTVAVLAPVTGVWVQAPRRRRRALGVLTGMAVALTCAMSLIRDDPSYLFAGLALLAFTAAFGDLASVPYNAMLKQLSTPENSGRISGFGWASGYLGSVTLLLLVYTGFIMGDGPTRGLLGIPSHDGENVRAAMLLAAAWFALFALPLLFTAQHATPAVEEPRERVGILGAYRKVWADVVHEWHRDRNLVYYLLASAVFRDGLAGVFAFGAVLGVSVYGISEADVLIFGVAASVVAAVGAVIGGFLDDRIGSKPVIVGSLAVMIAAGLTLLALTGPVAFWVCGLLLCLFLGPTQSSARTLLLRMSADGREGIAFGLYTMTGRAVSFLAPWLFFIFVDAFHADRAGMGGLCVVLAAGLLAMLAVKVPRRSPSPE